jgi:hypothetical protein
LYHLVLHGVTLITSVTFVTHVTSVTSVTCSIRKFHQSKYISTGPPPSPTVGDGTLLEASQPCIHSCWHLHANNAISSHIVHIIVTQFTAADATATALTAGNGTDIHIAAPTAAVGYTTTARPFIAIYFATAKVTTVAVDAPTIHVSFSIGAAAIITTDHLVIVIPFTTAKALFITTAANYATTSHQYNFINCTADNVTIALPFIATCIHLAWEIVALLAATALPDIIIGTFLIHCILLTFQHSRTSSHLPWINISPVPSFPIMPSQ